MREGRRFMGVLNVIIMGLLVLGGLDAVGKRHLVQGDEPASGLPGILEQVRPHLVALKFELELPSNPLLRGGGPIQQTAAGVAISSKVVMAPTSSFKAIAAGMGGLGKLLGGSTPVDDRGPTKFTIVTSDKRELTGTLTGRDEALGLSFVTVAGPEGADPGLHPVSFQAQAPGLADEVILVAPLLRKRPWLSSFVTGKVNVILDKGLLGTTVDPTAYRGGLALNAAGQPVGVLANEPKGEEDGEEGGANPLAGILSGGGVVERPIILTTSVIAAVVANPPANVKPEEPGHGDGKGKGKDKDKDKPEDDPYDEEF